MDVKFYPKTSDYRKAESAKLLFKGNTIGYEKGIFTRLSEEDVNVPVFISKGMLENRTAIEVAQKLLEEKGANVFLVCRPDFFKEFVKYSKAANMEAHLKYDAQEKILIYYVTIVDDKSILLIAYEDWD